jgi:hypothetical protein
VAVELLTAKLGCLSSCFVAFVTGVVEFGGSVSLGLWWFWWWLWWCCNVDLESIPFYIVSVNIGIRRDDQVRLKSAGKNWESSKRYKLRLDSVGCAGLPFGTHRAQP